MQLVGPDNVLRPLRNVPILRRQKLRRDRGRKNIGKCGGKTGILRHLRAVRDDVAHQGLRNPAVYAVIGHMIPVVRRPAQCQLGQIPRADHKAAVRVRNVHDDLRPFPCLRVFIDHGMVLRIVTDVAEMHVHRFLDVDRPERGAALLG